VSGGDARVLELAARLARERLAPRAADYDRDATNPVDSFALGYAAVYVGIAEAALAFAVDFLRKRVVKPENISVAQRGLLANRAKYLASDVGLEVTSRVIQTVGGRGAYRDFPAERAFRDMRTATLMPPTADRMLETIGKSALGLTEAMFRVSS